MTRARRKRYTWRSTQRAMAVATMSPEHIPGRRFSSCTKNIPTVSGRKKRPTGSNDAASPRKKKRRPGKTRRLCETATRANYGLGVVAGVAAGFGALVAGLAAVDALAGYAWSYSLMMSGVTSTPFDA